MEGEWWGGCSGCVIPGQFEEALSVGDGIDAVGRLRRHASVAGIAEEVEVEAVVLVLARAHERHAHDFLVELQRRLGRFHPQHRVVLYLSSLSATGLS